MLGTKYLLPVLLALGIAFPALPALPAGGEELSVKIQEVKVETKALAKSVEKRDASGQKRSYSQVTVVHLKGVFPPPMDTALDLFVGDTKIPEYGTTADGIYFKVYDPAILERHRGKELRYRFGNGPILSTGVKLEPGAAPRNP